MALSIFKKPFILRRFFPAEGDPESFTWQDYRIPLNVQPLDAKELMALPEGQRATKRVKAYGENRYGIRPADEDEGYPGDWLYYRGKWYMCEAGNDNDNTPVGQNVSQFVALRKRYPEYMMAAPDESGVLPL